MGRFWKISPGGLGRQWKNWMEYGVAAVGFSEEGEIGDPSKFDSVQELMEKYHSLGRVRIHQAARQLWRFTKEVQIGDFMVAYKLYHILDIGVVTGECTSEWDELAENNQIYYNRRQVHWLGLEKTEIVGEDARHYISKYMTIFSINNVHVIEQVRNLLETADEDGKLPKKFRKHLYSPPKATDIESPRRVKYEIYRKIRDTKKTRALKRIYENKCQICGRRIDIPGSGFYSEVHHIQPLGGDHSGPDTYSNMLCLCPWHHAEMDMKVFYIDPKTLTVVHSNKKNRYHGKSIHIDEEHEIDSHYLLYHRDTICFHWKQE